MGKDNIVLIGLPGAGKSTLGVVLAKMANFQFLDADLLLQEQQGQTLQALIDDKGVEGFLRLENEVLGGIDVHRTVISTGGSAVYSAQAMDHLRSIGEVVYLRISYDEMIDRLGDLDERGVVVRGGSPGDLACLFEERVPLYERYADITFDVTETPFRDAALELKGILEGRGCLDLPAISRPMHVFRQWRSPDMAYQMERQISFDMLDCHRHLRATEALRLFGDAANADFAELGGFTHEYLLEHGFFFIVTKASCHVVRDPRDEERVTIRTWPASMKGMQIARGFEMVDAQNAPVAYAQLMYLIINAETGHPIRVTDFPLLKMYTVDRPMGCELPRRIKRSDDMAECGRLRPRFSDIDANGHVNNTHYPTFAFDALPAELRSRRWVDFQIEYAAEMHLEDEMVLYASDAKLADAGEWVKVVGMKSDGPSHFGCQFRFE